MGDKGLLLYCITNSYDIEVTNILGLDQVNKLYYIEHKEMYGIVSDLDLDKYGEEAMESRSEDIEWLTENAKKFMDIMLAVHEKISIIPMKFMTIFNIEHRVKNIIEENYHIFISDFERIKGRQEYSVKIYCDNKVFKKNFIGEEIQKFEKSLVGKPKGAAFFLKKKFDSELDNKVQNKICKIANSIAENIQKIVVDMKSNKLLAKEITNIEIPMVLNCAFIIDINKIEKFSIYIEKIENECKKDGFSIEVSGPWPPYNFCE